MFNKRKSFFAVAFLLAAGLSITTAVNYTKTKTSETKVNNIVLTDQTEQTGQASVSETFRDNSMTSISAEANIEAIQDNSPKDNEVKIIAYTVKSGDTLDSIASTYNLKAKSIAESNSITTDSVLKEGQVLEFPSIDGVIYKIKSGETLWDLAMLNKIDFNKLVEINKLEAPEKLKLDQKIIMPGIDTVKPIPVKTANKLVASNTTLSRGGSGTASTNIIGSLPVSGKITSLFGPRWGRQHEGIDISAPVGTDVYASMDGTVSFSGWDGGYGYLVIIDHSNGLKSYYGHNSKLLVNVGQTVSKGDHIAEVGNTGNSTGPHCHFEIRKNGVPVNPYNYVK